MSDAVFHAPHRVAEGRIDDERDRREQHQDGQVRVVLLHQHDELRRHRRAAEIGQPEREKVLAPDMHRAQPLLDRDDNRDEAGIEKKEDGRE